MKLTTACRSLHATGDGRDEHHLVAVLEGVRIAAKEANVLVVDVDVDEPAELSLVVLDLGGERREVLIDVLDEGGKVWGLAGELLLAFSVADEGGRKNDFDGDGSAP